MRRVFLAEPYSRTDVSSAEEFGEIVPLCTTLPALDPAKTAAILDAAMERAGFDDEHDMICMTGNSIVLAVFLTVAIRRYGCVNMLVFNARLNRYERKTFDSFLLPEVSDV